MAFRGVGEVLFWIGSESLRSTYLCLEGRDSARRGAEVSYVSLWLRGSQAGTGGGGFSVASERTARACRAVAWCCDVLWCRVAVESQ